MHKDQSQKEHAGIKYLYAKEIVKKIKNRNLKKEVSILLEKGDIYRDKLDLITKEQIIDEITLFAIELGRTPKMREFGRDPRFTNYTTVAIIFGSWNKAIEGMFGG